MLWMSWNNYVTILLVVDLGHALVCAEFGSSRDSKVLDSKFRSMRKIIEQAHGWVRVGQMKLTDVNFYVNHFIVVFGWFWMNDIKRVQFMLWSHKKTRR